MDTGNWINLAGVVVTLAVAVIGWVIEHFSSKRRDKAQTDQIADLSKKFDNFKRQADALEREARAVEEDHRMRLEKPPFSDPDRVDDSQFRLTNRGVRPVVVEDFKCVPDIANARVDTPRTLQPNESITFVAIATFQTGTPVINVTWRWQDDETLHTESHTCI